MGVFYRLNRQDEPSSLNLGIYNRLFAWKESFAVVLDEFGGFYVSNEFPQFAIDQAVALPVYIYLLFNTKKIINVVNKASIGSSAISRNRFKESDFLDFKVPIPPLPVQQKIVEYWEKAKNNMEYELVKMEDAECSISTDILASANIRINFKNHRPIISAHRFKDLDRWGVGFNRDSWSLNNLITAQHYPCKPLGEFAFINPSTLINLDLSAFVSFVPMEVVSDKDGRIVSIEKRKLIEVRKGYTRFQEGDVLWAKITPCMQNGKSAMAINLVNRIGFGSTEFHVIRSKDTNVLMNEYIHLILRLIEVRRAAKRYFVGSAGQQRVPKEFLEGLYIPIPPIEIQKKLIEKINIARSEVTFIRTNSVSAQNNAINEIEQMILGTRLVEVN